MSNKSSILSQKKTIANVITLIILIVGIVFVGIGIKNNNDAKELTDSVKGTSYILSTQSKKDVEEYQKTAKITIPIGCVICVGAIIYKLHSKSRLLTDEGKNREG